MKRIKLPIILTKKVIKAVVITALSLAIMGAIAIAMAKGKPKK